MIKEAMEHLLDLPERVFDYYLFTQDPLKGKVNAAEKRDILENSRQCGYDVSRKLKDTYGDQSIDDYLQLLEIDLTYEDTNNGLEYIYFGTFQKPNKLTIYTENIQKGQDLAQEENIAELQEMNFQAIVKAHELFHYFEESDQRLYVNTHKIPLWHFLGYTHRSKLVASSEIASMAFAKDLLALDFAPHVLDVLLLYPHNQDQAKTVYNRIIEQIDYVEEIEG